MSIQVSEALTQFGYYKQDISDVETPVFVSWCQFIERDVYRRLIKLFPNKFIDTEDYSVTNGSQALPANFDNIRSLGTGFYQLVNGQLQPGTLAMTYPGAQIPGFYFQGASVVFTGFQSAQTFRLAYIPKLVVVAEESDYFTLDGTENGIEIIPDQYMDFLVKALDVYYTQWDNMPTDESFADERYLRLLNEFLENFLPTPNIFPTEDPFSIYGFSGGIYPNNYPWY